MNIDLVPMRRTFLYNGRTLPDPDGSMTPEQVKNFFANIHPELINAAVEGGNYEGDTQVFEFRRAIGTKGGHALALDSGDCLQSVPPVPMFQSTPVSGREGGEGLRPSRATILRKGGGFQPGRASDET
jgi:PRTRC genetic system protein C